MSDHRTRQQKLRAMARQDASPNEARVARRKLGIVAPADVLEETGDERLAEAVEGAQDALDEAWRRVTRR